MRDQAAPSSSSEDTESGSEEIHVEIEAPMTEAEWRHAREREREREQSNELVRDPHSEKHLKTEADGEEIRQIRAKLAATERVSPYRVDTFGEFEHEADEKGRIVLGPEQAKAVGQRAASFRREAKYMTNTVTGEPIAVEYKGRTNNFSTQTRITELPDGRKVFMIYDHKGSSFHRFLDGTMKRMSGLRMQKVPREDWKSQFESKSNIPIIPNEDPDTVLLPFLPNVNGNDLFAHNGDIKDFGECAWANDAGVDEKLELALSLVDETQRIHDQGKAWGELIMPNVIFTKDKKPVICDPEIRYDEDMPVEEAKARDLRDLVLSVCATLAKAHQTDPEQVVGPLLDRYKDGRVIDELKTLLKEKRSLLMKLTMGYELVRTGHPNAKAYDRVIETMRAHLEPTPENE